jgi:hypothetical protein
MRIVYSKQAQLDFMAGIGALWNHGLAKLEYENIAVFQSEELCPLSKEY